MEAVESNNYDEVMSLLMQGADPNYTGADGATALIMAAEAGKADIVKLLIQSKADTQVKDKRSLTALQVAADDKIRYMLSCSLISAAFSGNISLVAHLLDQGAVANYVDEHGNTALIKPLARATRRSRGY